MRSVLAAVIFIGTTLTAAAQTGPVIVIPGRPPVPVLINGQDASYAVVAGDWGLGKGIHVEPTVIYGRAEYNQPPVGHYYPSEGRIPGYGRVEIEPPANHQLPPQAESYWRSWSAASGPPQQQVNPPANPPPVIVAPQFSGSGRRFGR